MFPPETGIKHLVLVIPRFLAFIGLQVFILPRVLCFFTPLWWVIVALAVIKAKRIQGCVSKSTASRLREVIISLYLACLRSHLGYRIQFWAQVQDRYQQDRVQWRDTGMVRKLEDMMHRERQKAGFGREKRAKVASNFSLPLSKGCYLEGVIFFSDVHRRGTGGSSHSLQQGTVD